MVFKSIKELCTPFSSNISINKLENNIGEYPLYGASGFVKNIDFYQTDKPFISIVKDGAGVGRIAIHHAKSSIVGTMQGIYPNENVNIKWLYYVLKKQKLEEYKSGSTIPHIYFKDYGKNMVKFVKLNIQKQIVNVLDNIESQINYFKLQIKHLDELVKSQFIEMFGDPKDNPNGYEIKNISELFNVGSSKRVFESEWTDSGVPFYRAREIVKLSKDGYVDNDLFITEEMYENYKNKYGVPQEDDMMVTGVGTLGICYIVKKEDKFYFKDGNTLWFKNKGLCNVRFIKDQYNTDFIREQIEVNANASTVGTYTITNANNTKVLVPPIDLQNEYVRFCEQIDKSKFIIQKQIKLLEELLEKKMNEYFGQ